MKFSMERSTGVAKTVNGQRFAVALACWCCAGIGVMGSFMFSPALVLSTPGINDTDVSHFFMRLEGIALLVAWLALGVMTNGWVQDRKVNWFWLLVGSLSGIPSVILFAPFWPFYISTVPLALYLVYFHLSQYRNARGNDV